MSCRQKVEVIQGCKLSDSPCPVPSLIHCPLGKRVLPFSSFSCSFPVCPDLTHAHFNECLKISKTQKCLENFCNCVLLASKKRVFGQIRNANSYYCIMKRSIRCLRGELHLIHMHISVTVCFPDKNANLIPAFCLEQATQ